MSEERLKNFFNKLDDLRKQLTFIHLTEGLIKTLLWFTIFFFFISLIEFFFSLEKNFRLILFISILISLLGLIVYFITIPLLRSLRKKKEEVYLSLGQLIGLHFSQIKDKLVNILQLIFSLDKSNYYSKDLTFAAIEQNLNYFNQFNFNEVINKEKIKKYLKYFLVTVTIFTLLGLAFPDLPFASYRILNFNKDFVKPPEFYIVIEPGNKKITKGENYSCRIKTIGKELGKIDLYYSFEGMEIFDKVSLEADSIGEFKYTFVAPPRSFKIYAEAKNVKSEIYSVEVINYPVIKELSLKIFPPSYTKLQPQFYEDDGNINTIKGSTIELNIKSSKTLGNAKILFDDSTSIKMNVSGFSASVKFRATKSGSYKILITDSEGYPNLNPVEYQINLIEDLAPSISLIIPQGTVDLTENMRVPLVFRIKDDYGFSKLTLNYRLSYSRYEQPKEKYTTIQIPFGNSLDTTITYIWNLSSLNLVTDDVVSYYLEVFDNDFVSGPKSAQTQLMQVRIPSLEEILAEGNEKFENTIQDAKSIQKEVEDLKQKLEELDKEIKTPKDLKQQDKLSWEEQKKTQDLIKKHEEVLQKVENLQQQLNELQNKLNENKTLSKETLQKFMELQELLNQLDSKELKEAIQRLNEALKSLNRQMLQEALKNFQFNEENFRASIERTIELLKRIQIEQKMDEALKRLEQMNQKLDELMNELENTNPNDQQKLNELSKKQDQLTKDIENLEKNLEDLQERMEQFQDEMPTEEMKKLAEEFMSQNPQQCSRRSSEQMKRGDVKSSKENQKNLKSSFGKLQEGLNQLKQEMMRNQMMQTMIQLQRITNDLISLSKQQENLKNRTSSTEPSSPQVNEITRKQAELMENLKKLIDRMIELSNKTFAITPEMGRAVGKAMINMNESIENLLNRNLSISSQSQKDAMGNLNEAADLIQDMLQNMMQGGQGGGMMSFMQRLQQMAQQQMNLNNLTQMLGQGKLSMEQLSQLQRLAAEQEMIRKSLEELNREMKEAGQSSRLLGDLEDVAKKMEEVVRELKQNNVSDDLIQKQERILTRLLDATRSMNERDYEKRRESRPGEQISGKPPEDLKLNQDDLISKIRQDLLKALEEGYAKDYEILIRKYFEALQKQKLLMR
ncbi:MAG: hypothetical protein N3F03_02365 [Ignavibacteria bacterium]|nr:hypothetical protein [Ignavibacteria bacterium]